MANMGVQARRTTAQRPEIDGPDLIGPLDAADLAQKAPARALIQADGAG
jgi:hypothetical protein